jgi:3',5'-cyclic AMP phosphodiesterase CpdA
MALAASVASRSSALELLLPNKPDSLKFAVLGDFGTGERPSHEIAAQMAALRTRFPFELVITTGDNVLERQGTPDDLVVKFERPYAPLLRAGVRFYASLGNHDRKADRYYGPWNMNGSRYYTFAKRNVRFFALDTNRLDREQLDWIEQALRSSTDDWKICYFHHPLYSNGETHGPSLELRVMLEPLFVRYGVDVVFAGHDHIYERLKPQKGIQYFVVGAGGQRDTGIEPGDDTAAAFDADRSFLAVEVSGSVLSFEALSRVGTTIDGGVVRQRPKP